MLAKILRVEQHNISKARCTNSNCWLHIHTNNTIICHPISLTCSANTNIALFPYNSVTTFRTFTCLAKTTISSETGCYITRLDTLTIHNAVLNIVKWLTDWHLYRPQGKVMFSETSVSHSVHNRSHGYSVTAQTCYSAVGTHPTGMLSCS